jgi:hypothetical protein
MNCQNLFLAFNVFWTKDDPALNQSIYFWKK